MTSSLHITCLVIGATSGIGGGLAEQIHASGKKVIACGRRQNRLDDLASKHAKMTVQQFDLSKVDTFEAQLESV